MSSLDNRRKTIRPFDEDKIHPRLSDLTNPERVSINLLALLFGDFFARGSFFVKGNFVYTFVPISFS